MRLLETKAARADLDKIFLHSLKTYGEAAAGRYIGQLLDLYDLILSQPEMARQREEIDPPVRIHPYGAHLIVYRIGEGTVTIIRILPSAADWQNEFLPTD